MKIFVQGVGAVSPLGPNAIETWDQLCQGKQASRRLMANPLGGRHYFWCPVPPKFLSEAARQPRLRRSGTVSLLGVAAGLDALADGGFKPAPENGRRIGIVFAICSGGVIYTRRLYHEIVTQGANAASPMLFPETVYNAPASHMAALLGVDAQCYTLVGDSSVGLSALHFASELLQTRPDLDQCLVVGTEEADWLLADAFSSWRMATTKETFEVYGAANGTIFAEGAAAVLLGKTGSLLLSNAPAGRPFFSRRESAAVAIELLSGMLAGGKPDLIIGSANGTFADEVERIAFTRLFGSVPVFAPKPAIGEALGASALFQVVLGCLALRHGQIPGTLNAGPKLDTVNRCTRPFPLANVLTACVGFNQQINAASVQVCEHNFNACY